MEFLRAALVTTTVVAMAAVAVTNGQTTAPLNIVNMTVPGGLSLPSSQVTTHNLGSREVVEEVVDLIGHSCIFNQDYLYLRRLASVLTRDGQEGLTYASANSSFSNGGIWRVSESIFRSTQANSPELQTKYTQIRDAFGIDWMSVQWRDLRMPLYSGLAASLYNFLQGNVSETLEGQARDANANYNVPAFDYVRRADNTAVCNQDQQIDVAFLIDSTISANDFVRTRQFVADVAEMTRNLTSGSMRVAVYQYGRLTGGATDVQKNIVFSSYSDPDQLLNGIRGLSQAGFPQTTVDVGHAVTTVIDDAFANSQRPLSAKVVMLVTDKATSDNQSVVSAGHDALAKGVSVMAVGVGSGVSQQELDQLVTRPACVHQIVVQDVRNLRGVVPLVQRAICHEPMIAQGMVHCPIEQCRNVAFPTTSSTTTLIANVTCDNGRVFVTTRTPRPGRGFQDFTADVESGNGPAYVTIDDVTGNFIYADFDGLDGSDPSCVATLSTVNGVVGPAKEEACEDWRYPPSNPCQVPGRTADRFPYDRDTGMFLQCDLRDQMYLTKCPPGEPYYSRDCRQCVGGPNSPTISGCRGQPATTGFCGLPSNPCTRDNVLSQRLYFACPLDETQYLQCNNWGHAFVMQCQQNEVWRQHALSCEFENTQYNPCGTPGVRYYPYPNNPQIFVDCGSDMVPNLKTCQGDLVWNPTLDVCDFPSANTAHPATHLTARITLPPTTPGGGIGLTPQPGTGLLSKGYAAPCTREHVAAQRLFWPYPGHPRQYIQCDLWGDAFVKNCQAGYYYDEISHTCVNGPVIVDNQVIG